MNSSGTESRARKRRNTQKAAETQASSRRQQPEAQAAAEAQPVFSIRNLTQSDLVWDAGGLILFALALITGLGLLGITRGLLIDPWTYWIRKGFGYGAVLVVITLLALAVACLRQHFPALRLPSLGRILALEAAAFLGMAFLAIVGGMETMRAEAGQDGGFVGWGLASILLYLIPLPWGAVAIALLALVFFGYGTGLIGKGSAALMGWLDGIQHRYDARGTGAVEEPVEDSLAEAAPQRQATFSPDRKQVAEQPELPVQAAVQRPDVALPPLTLLQEENSLAPDEALIAENGRKIESTLADFGIPVHVLGYRQGPTLTQYAVEPGFVDKPGPDGVPVQQKVRVAQISLLQRDLALALKSARLRIEAPVPGRSYVGIEVPNPSSSVVRLRSLMESSEFQKLDAPLAIALGKDVSGQAVVADLARMPHMLIAGTTMSGKSISIISMVTCLAMNNPPDRLRLALMDPKMVELVRFNGLPHLLGRVETSIDRILGVLKWAQMEMDQRYKLLETARSRDIDTYNRRAEKKGQPSLPRIVLVIDELADLMMTAAAQTEDSLVRLAQMARAVGIHLMVATQRPSALIITGLIKANFPARLAFSVASGIDSRVILDTTGAETLLGKGDLLWMNPEVGSPIRAQGALVSDTEVQALIEYWREKSDLSGESEAPWEDVLAQEEEEGEDTLIQQAVEVVRRAGKASVSLLQRRMRVGYPRAARLIDELEEMGVVGPSLGSGRDREVLLDDLDDDELSETDDESFTRDS